MVLIHRDKEGNWTIGPEDEESNKQRFRNHEDSADDAANTFDGRWGSRHGKNADRPRPHDPIFFLEGDVFQFQCEGGPPIWHRGDKESRRASVTRRAGRSAEWWEGGEQGLDGTRVSRDGRPLTATVKRSDGEAPGVKAQRFYKFHGWVRVSGEFTPVDPDGYLWRVEELPHEGRQQPRRGTSRGSQVRHGPDVREYGLGPVAAQRPSAFNRAYGFGAIGGTPFKKYERSTERGYRRSVGLSHLVSRLSATTGSTRVARNAGTNDTTSSGDTVG